MTTVFQQIALGYSQPEIIKISNTLLSFLHEVSVSVTKGNGVRESGRLQAMHVSRNESPGIPTKNYHFKGKKADDETDVSNIVWKVDVVVNTVVSQGPQVGLHPQVK